MASRSERLNSGFKLLKGSKGKSPEKVQKRRQGKHPVVQDPGAEVIKQFLAGNPSEAEQEMVRYQIRQASRISENKNE